MPLTVNTSRVVLMPDAIVKQSSYVSHHNKRPVLGVGINDAPYAVTRYEHGKRVSCPYYLTWHRMLQRCYSDNLQKTHPTYIGCTVAPAWHSFMEFRDWMCEQDWRDKHLDKDLMIPGNTEYAPDKCVFLDSHTNNLFKTNLKTAGKYSTPQGVCYHKRHGVFVSSIKIRGHTEHLGSYTDMWKAAFAYRERKSAYISELALLESDTRIRAALQRRASMILIGFDPSVHDQM